MKVKNVIVKGYLGFSPLTPLNYAYYKGLYGDKFPSSDTLKLDFNDNWNVLINPITVRVVTDTEVLSWDFKEGFCWDLASCPKAIRWLLDDNDPTVIIPSLQHDYCFSSHCLSFEDSDYVFREIIKSQGGNWMKRTLYWLGVRSFVGRILYNKATIKRSWHLEFCDFKREELQ